MKESHDGLLPLVFFIEAVYLLCTSNISLLLKMIFGQLDHDGHKNEINL